MKASPRIVAALLCGLSVAGCGGWFCWNGGRSGPSASDTCVEHLKIVGAALLSYAVDWDDRYPLGPGWMDVLIPYVQPRLYALQRPVLENASPTEYGFAFHPQIAGLPWQSVPNPGTTITLFESTDTDRNVVGTENLLPSVPRHNGLNTIAYADTRVKAVRP